MDSAKDLRFVVGEEENPARLDKYLSSVLPDLSRSYLQSLIRTGGAMLNGKVVKAHRRVIVGDLIELHVPEPVTLNVEPQEIPLEVLYEDADMLCINKQPGLVVHPAPGHLDATLVNALLFHTRSLSTINGVLRPGIVHRLDMDTSGCIVVAKNDQAHRGLAVQFENRTVTKEYVAIVVGRLLRSSGIIDQPIGRHPTQRRKMAVTLKGREAKTRFERKELFADATLLSLYPKTGRTHQIRVHLAAMGFPVLGDKRYGTRKLQLKNTFVTRHMLHAKVLSLQHPRTQKPLRCEAPLPADMERLLESLRR